MKDSSPLGSRKIPDKIHFQAIHSESSDTFSDQSPTLAPGPLVQPPSKTQTEMQFVNEEDLEALGAAAPPLPVAEELKPPAACTTQAASKTDSPSRKKGTEPAGRAWAPCSPPGTLLAPDAAASSRVSSVSEKTHIRDTHRGESLICALLPSEEIACPLSRVGPDTFSIVSDLSGSLTMSVTV